MTGRIFNIQRFSIQDGPGIRTTVFMKGCPLKCLWCANPESMDARPQLLYIEAHCARCYRCIEACPNGANSKNVDGSIRIDRNLCKGCGKCVEACPNEARVLCGKQMTVDEVMVEVKKDALFYRNSGGGVTASGGEPTQQADFLVNLFKKCQTAGFHTALDTCGYVKWERLERILKYTDLVLFDLKNIDPTKHKELTGANYGLVLENAKQMAKKGIDFIVRAPLIPGRNDSTENLHALASFVIKLGKNMIDILPYHRLGAGKNERLGKQYALEKTQPFTKEELQGKVKILESCGLDVSIK